MADEDQYPELDPGIPVPEEPMVESRRVPSIVHASPFPIVPPEGVVLPSSLRNQPYVPRDPAERQAMAMSRAFESLPIAQAEKAVETALKFQGMRTYQRALSEGKSAEEAMRIAGPMIFGSTGMRGMMITPAQAAAQNLREREFAFRQQQANTAATRAKVHFGPNGQVLQEKGGAVSVIRPPDPGPPKYRGVNTTLPEDQFGPQISGPSDHPDIQARLKQRQDAIAAAAAEPPPIGPIGRAWRAITGGGTPAPVAPPSAPGAIRLGGGVTMGGPPPAPAPAAPIRVAPPTTPAPMSGMSSAAPMPKNKADLVPGRWYQARGKFWRYTGTGFVPAD